MAVTFAPNTGCQRRWGSGRDNSSTSTLGGGVKAVVFEEVLVTEKMLVVQCKCCCVVLYTSLFTILVDRKTQNRQYWEQAGKSIVRIHTLLFGDSIVEWLKLDTSCFVQWFAIWCFRIGITECPLSGRGHSQTSFNFGKQEAFEKCLAHSPLRAAVTLPFTSCRYCRTPAIHVAIAQAACDVHDDNDNNNNDNAWQRGPLWPHGMGPISVNISGTVQDSDIVTIADE